MNTDAVAQHAPHGQGIEIWAAGPEHVPGALSILREASRWMAGRGLRAWTDEELQKVDLPGHSAAGSLILGFTQGKPAACMLLQCSDALYWPGAARGSALYLHKLAVSRAYAGCGWGSRMIAWAKLQAQRQGISRLRLDTWADSRLAGYYVRYGFRLIDRVTRPENGDAMCRMECRLQTTRRSPSMSGIVPARQSR